MLLQHDLEPGKSKAVIARPLGVSRRTVYDWVKTGQLNRGGKEELVQYGPRRPVRSKLDPYPGIVDARLAEYPKLTATRLFREVRKAGDPGGLRVGEARRGPSAASGSPGGGPTVRDAAGTPGPGGGRGFPVALGEAVRTYRGAGRLPVAVVPVS